MIPITAVDQDNMEKHRKKRHKPLSTNDEEEKLEEENAEERSIVDEKHMECSMDKHGGVMQGVMVDNPTRTPGVTSSVGKSSIKTMFLNTRSRTDNNKNDV